MRAVGNNLDCIGVKLFVRDGLGRIVKDGRNVVFGLNMCRDGGRVGLEDSAILNITLKDL
jgi:hypothetical protein